MLQHLATASNCNSPWEQPLSLAEVMGCHRAGERLGCVHSAMAQGGIAGAHQPLQNLRLLEQCLWVGFLRCSATCLGGPACPTVEILHLTLRACRCLVSYYSREEIPAAVRGGENTAE